MQPAGAQGWIVRHKKLSAFLAVLSMLWLAGVVSGEEPDPDQTASTTADRGHSDPPEEDAGENDQTAGEATESPSQEATETPKSKKITKPSAKPHPKPKRSPKPAPAPRTFVVTRVVDGDTVELSNGETVRLVGIDTPEVGQCGADRATANLERLVLFKRVRLTVSDEDRDGYGRLLRYVNAGPQDSGLRLIKNGLAISRYDSRDGYGFHPREPQYIAADRTSRNFRCPKPAPAPALAAPSGGNCAIGYSPCIPPYPPDLDCGDVTGPIYVTGSDPHGLDAEGDGVGCE